MRNLNTSSRCTGSMPRVHVFLHASTLYSRMLYLPKDKVLNLTLMWLNLTRGMTLWLQLIPRSGYLFTDFWETELFSHLLLVIMIFNRGFLTEVKIHSKLNLTLNSGKRQRKKKPTLCECDQAKRVVTR